MSKTAVASNKLFHFTLSVWNVLNPQSPGILPEGLKLSQEGFEWTRVARWLKTVLPSPWTIFTHWQLISRHWSCVGRISLSEIMEGEASPSMRSIRFDDKEFSLALSLSLFWFHQRTVMCSFIVFFERLLYFSINNAHFECFVMFRKTLLINDKYSSSCRQRGPPIERPLR